VPNYQNTRIAGEMVRLWRKPFDAEVKTTPHGKVVVDKDKCKGCGYCSEFCPREALFMTEEINSKGYTLAGVKDESKCLSCGLCQVICPEFAIKVEAPAVKEK
jgi:2-oxoglutarate ferredoxin oxidoreductase subunit delta